MSIPPSSAAIASTRAIQIRQKFTDRKLVRAAGARDALTAPLAEEAGFDAVDVAMAADRDSGFGGNLNAAFAMMPFEAAGVAAVCIEDKTFRKRTRLLDDLLETWGEPHGTENQWRTDPTARLPRREGDLT